MGVCEEYDRILRSRDQVEQVYFSAKYLMFGSLLYNFANYFSFKVKVDAFISLDCFSFNYLSGVERILVD